MSACLILYYEVWDGDGLFVAQTADLNLARLILPPNGTIFECSKVVRGSENGKITVTVVKNEI